MTPHGRAPRHLDYGPAAIPPRRAPGLSDFAWLAVWGVVASVVVGGGWLLMSLALQMYFGGGG